MITCLESLQCLQSPCKLHHHKLKTRTCLATFVTVPFVVLQHASCNVELQALDTSMLSDMANMIRRDMTEKPPTEMEKSLYSAVLSGDISLVKHWIDQGADVNKRFEGPSDRPFHGVFHMKLLLLARATRMSTHEQPLLGIGTWLPKAAHYVLRHLISLVLSCQAISTGDVDASSAC